jgi:uncharacterized protein YecE (DUF72 family)
MTNRRSNSNIFVGCQSWSYDDWKTLRGGPTVFFPPGVKESEKLSFYGQIFDTVEMDGTFYAIPKAADLKNWASQVPRHFKFSAKMPKEVTHVYNLSSQAYPVAKEFLERMAVLEDKLAVILIQLQNTFKKTKAARENVENFLSFLPKDFRYAIEFRSAEWFEAEIFELLAERNVALCLGQNEFLDRETMLTALESPSADFSYFRFSGKRDLTRLDRIQRPQTESIEFWAGKIRSLSNREVFVYFSNLFEGFSPASVQAFRKLIGQSFITPDELNPAPSLF